MHTPHSQVTQLSRMLAEKAIPHAMTVTAEADNPAQTHIASRHELLYMHTEHTPLRAAYSSPPTRSPAAPAQPTRASVHSQELAEVTDLALSSAEHAHQYRGEESGWVGMQIRE